jgi:hypothetical protein
LVPDQLGHSNSSLSVVEATVSLNLMHSPSADPSTKNKTTDYTAFLLIHIITVTNNALLSYFCKYWEHPGTE